MAIIIQGGQTQSEDSVQADSFTPPGAITLPSYPSTQLGNPVVCDFNTETFTYFNAVLNQNITVSAVKIQKCLFMLVKKPKHIVATAINGRDGDVFEYISKASAEINVKGTLYAPAGQYPMGDVQLLDALADAPTSFVINNWYLQGLNLSRFIISKDGIKYTQREGYPSEQNFEMDLLSDTPIGVLMQQGNAQ